MNLTIKEIKEVIRTLKTTKELVVRIWNILLYYYRRSIPWKRKNV